MSVLAAVGVTAFIGGFALVIGGVAVFLVWEEVEPVVDVLVKVGLALVVLAAAIGIVAIIGGVWSEVTW